MININIWNAKIGYNKNFLLSKFILTQIIEFKINWAGSNFENCHWPINLDLEI